MRHSCRRGSFKDLNTRAQPPVPAMGREGESTMTISRRDFIQVAAAMGASLAWAGSEAASPSRWRERRDLFPEGVASGDPDPHSEAWAGK